MYKEDGKITHKSTDDIYENIDVTKGKFGQETTDSNTTGIQSSELKGSDSVKIRSSRAAAVCLVLLCALLLTAVVVLCVIFTHERRQLLSKNENLTNEREQLILKNTNLTNEREQLILKNTNLTNEREQLIWKKNYFQTCLDGWIYYQSSFYYMSSDTINWAESRRYCTERGADLVIINNREELDFVKNISGNNFVWIGLTDIDVEGVWKWVDGSTLTAWYFLTWNSGNSDYKDCALSYSSWWYDYPCYETSKWICETSTLHIAV